MLSVLSSFNGVFAWIQITLLVPPKDTRMAQDMGFEEELDGTMDQR